MSRLSQRYQTEIIPQLQTEFGVKNVHLVPRVEKIIVNVGLGRATQDSRVTEVATTTLRKVTGQQPIPTKAKHSIASFKLRQGQKIGLKTTLRRERMYEFLDRLISVVIPRVRDFHGLSVKAFDPHGNYTIGLPDQSVFPELTFEEMPVMHGLEVTIVTTGTNREQSARLLELLGLPLERSQ
ncbi:50S ribosomal protein L5 [Candidatus Microgenomates bacterium]|nr:50S ribosomal protein L5 [Candidatus Microgenomates bacterium]